MMNTQLLESSWKKTKRIWKLTDTLAVWVGACLLYGYVLYASFLYGKFIFHLTNDYCFSPAKVHVWFWLFILAAWLVIWTRKRVPNSSFLRFFHYGWSGCLLLISLGVFFNEWESSGKHYGSTFGNLVFFEGGDYLLYVWCSVEILIISLCKKIRWYTVLLNTAVFMAALLWGIWKH